MSTKTCFALSPNIVFRLPGLPGSSCCPLRAWVKYASHIRLLKESPAFILPSGVPLSGKTLPRALD